LFRILSSGLKGRKACVHKSNNHRRALASLPCETLVRKRPEAEYRSNVLQCIGCEHRSAGIARCQHRTRSVFPRVVVTIEVDEGKVHVTFTLTAPGCPIGPEVAEQIEEFVSELDGVESVGSTMVFTPPWTPERMSDDAKFALGY